jgi:carboxypeptidase Taq
MQEGRAESGTGARAQRALVQESLTPPHYIELAKLLREAATLSSVMELLGWDQETMMPAKAASFRAEELAMLSRLAHQRATDPRIGELLAACEADDSLRTSPAAQANLREIRRDYDRALRLPEELVAEISETSSRAIEAWRHARERSDFQSFQPWLEQQLYLQQRKAECHGVPPGGELYDALLEDYEPGLRTAELERIFGPLKSRLTPLIGRILSSGQHPSQEPLQLDPPLEQQRALHRRVLGRIGFDFDAGRLDTSTHPFSAGLGPCDTRITTRFPRGGFADALSSTLHEVGHALYEQGLPKESCHGQPLSEPLGLGIHESQSRLWENHVGRSRAFWSWVLPEAKSLFGPALAHTTVDAIYRAINTVRPSLIRIESDEATYNLHIMLRFDLERAMVRDDLRPADLPAAWNQRIQQDLGLPVPDDRHGCLQDIHWAMGSFGYFPSYTLGNLYAAQFWEALLEAVPDLEQQIASGEFAALLGWLRSEIHRGGRQIPTATLCQRLTGRGLDHEALMRHLEGKFGAVYELGRS